MQRAKSLRSGDKVSLIAPSSAFDPKHFAFARCWLEARGYEPVFRKDIFSTKAYLAGSDQRRKKEFEGALSGNSKAVFCARGGYGAMRLFFDGLRLKKGAPKIFMGLSDPTVLLNYLAFSRNMVTIHGPVLAGHQFFAMSERQRRHAFSLLEQPKVQELFAPRDFQTIVAGRAKGTLWGGNLSLVAASLGTKFQIPTPSKAILFLEEVQEPPYRVDRLMTQLSLSGFLSKFQAVLLGDFTDAHGKIYSKQSLKSLIQPLLAKNVPLIYGIGSSHVRMEVLLPIGGEVEVQPKKIIVSALVS